MFGLYVTQFIPGFFIQDDKSTDPVLIGAVSSLYTVFSGGGFSCLPRTHWCCFDARRRHRLC